MLLNEIHKSEERNELILLNCHLYYGVWAKLRKSICSVLGSSSKYMFSERENLAPQQTSPQKKNERKKTVKCEATTWFQFPFLRFPLILQASHSGEDLKTYLYPKTELQPSGYSTCWDPSCSESPNLCGFWGLSSCPQRFDSCPVLFAVSLVPRWTF